MRSRGPLAVSIECAETAYPRDAISFARENINTRDGPTLDLATEAPDFCISRRTRAKVFRTSVDALGT